MSEKESRTKWMFLLAFSIGAMIFWKTTLGIVWSLILSTFIFCLLAVSPLNARLKTSNNVFDETDDMYALLFFTIGIAIAYGFLGCVL